MKKSSITLVAVATLGMCASLCKGAQHKISPFIQEKKESFLSFASYLGFTIPPSFQPVHITNEVDPDSGWHFRFNEYKENGNMNHYTDVYDALLESSDDPDVYLYCYRVTLEPYWARHWGFLGIGSYGDNWALESLKTTVQFQKTISFGPQNTPKYVIYNYAPKNQPDSWGSTIGFDVGLSSSGLNASVSANVNYNHSELSVSSYTKTGDPFYETDYNFSPVGGILYTDYLTNAVHCYGMVLFGYHYNVDLVINHDIQYHGLAYYHSGEAGRVHFGYHLRNR